jgi:uncharacterized protein (DUF1330 family)
MSVYLIAHVKINNPDQYAGYEEGFLDIFIKFQGEIIAVDDAPVSIEGGEKHERIVLVKFPDQEQAMHWYQSPEYQQLTNIRWANAESTIQLITAF